MDKLDPAMRSIRLIISQKFISSSNYYILTKNVEESLNFLITFSEGTSPPDSDEMAKLPYQLTSVTQSHSTFSRFIQSPDEKFSSIQWEGGMKHFQSFFAELYDMRVQSLRQCELTKELLFSSNILKKTQASMDEGATRKNGKANCKAQTVEKMKNALQMEIEQLKRTVAVSTERINHCLNLLKNIALLGDE